MSRRFEFSQFRREFPALLPSMLLCDFGNLEREVVELERAGICGLHLDVMDGSFVPNFTYGLTLVRAFRALTERALDVHLMIDHPERYVGQFCEAGADLVSVHAEATNDLRPLLREIRQYGSAAGIALNPGTPVSQVDGALDEADFVVVMTVQPGFGSQAFLPQPLAKINSIRQRAPGIVIEVDGGLGEATLSECVARGADLLVAGSAIFREADRGSAVRRLQGLIKAATVPSVPVDRS